MHKYSIDFWNFICKSLDAHTIDTKWYESAVLYFKDGYFYSGIISPNESISLMSSKERITLDLIVYNLISE